MENSRIITTVLLIVIPLLLVQGVMFIANKKAKAKIGDNVIKQPYVFLVVMVTIATISFAGLILLAIFRTSIFETQEDMIVAFVMISLFLLFTIGASLGISNWKVEFFDDYLILTNIFRKKKTYAYRDLRLVQFGQNYKVCVGRRKIFGIGPIFNNYAAFLEAYQKQGNQIEIR